MIDSSIKISSKLDAEIADPYKSDIYISATEFIKLLEEAREDKSIARKTFITSTNNRFMSLTKQMIDNLDNVIPYLRLSYNNNSVRVVKQYDIST